MLEASAMPTTGSGKRVYRNGDFDRAAVVLVTPVAGLLPPARKTVCDRPLACPRTETARRVVAVVSRGVRIDQLIDAEHRGQRACGVPQELTVRGQQATVGLLEISCFESDDLRHVTSPIRRTSSLRASSFPPAD